jgi:PAS domain S-box-containing protein
LSRPTPQQLVDSAPEALVVDRDLTIRAVGARVLELFGHELEDLVGMPFEAILCERVRAHHVELLRAAFNRPDAHATLGLVGVLGVRKGGEERELNVELARVATRRGLMMLATIHDARREARTLRAPPVFALADSAYRVLFESLPDTVLVVDAEGALQLSNRAPPPPFGTGDGRSAFADLEPEGRRALEAAVARVAREGGTVELELSCARASYFCRIAPLPEAGAEARFAVVLTDVTRRLDLAAERAAADRMESVGTLAAGLAHEINNPLTTVIANLDFVVEELEADGSVEEKLAAVGAALRDARLGANRVRDLVRDVKMLSRGDDAQREVVDARWIVEASLALAKDEILRRARLVRAFAKTPQVDCNSGRLGHAILHLLMNAVEAIPEGNPADNEIHVATRVDASGRVVIEVRDTGMGIAEADLPRLFTPFFTRKPAGEGEGLGLAICRRIVTAAGGDVEVTSELGVGTTVRVLLPAAAAAAEVDGGTGTRRKHASGTRMKPLRKGRLLVVDGGHGEADLLRVALEDHIVTIVPGVAEALEALGTGARPDVIFCSAAGAGMALLDALRRGARGRHDVERVVLLAGAELGDDTPAYFTHLGVRVLPHPLDEEELQELVRERVEAAISAAGRRKEA